MADLGKTDAQWADFLEGTTFPALRQWFELENLAQRFERQRIQVRNVNDATSATPHITAVTLTGVDYTTANRNTTLRGELVVRFVANGGNWDVHLYKATGGGAGNEVGRVTNVAASATGTIVAQNSSGLGGTITLGATIAGDVTDKHRLVVDVDWAVESAMRWPNDGTNDDDAFSAAAFTRSNSRVAARIREGQASVEQYLLEVMTRAFDNAKAWGKDFLNTDENSLRDETVRTDRTTGVVTRTVAGVLMVLKRAMEDETTGSTQDVLERVVDAQAAVFDASNDGKGTVADHTPGENCPAGVWTFTCIAGHNDGPEIAGKEKFSVRFSATDGDEDYSEETFAELTVGESYAGPLGFGPITLARTFTKTNDGTNTKSGAVSTWSFTNESGNNTASGKLYVKIVDAGGSTYNYEFYKSEAGRSAGNDHGDFMAAVNGVAASTATQATQRNGSGLSIDFDTGSSPSGGDTFEIDLNFFSSARSDGEADSFSITTAPTGTEGLIQLLAGRFLKIAFPSDTSGSEQLSDDLVRVNVPHIDYLAVTI